MEGKYNIEINFVGDGRTFLNYWDYRGGEDVVAEIVDGSLYDDNEEISFTNFLERVKAVIENYPEQKQKP